MLTPDEWRIIELNASKLFTKLEFEIIEEIVTRILNVGYANTVVINDLKVIQEIGIAYEDILKIISTYLNVSVGDIRNIFENAGATTIKKDDLIYKRVGLIPKELEKSRILKSSINQAVNNNISNLNSLLRTIPDNATKMIYEAIQKASIDTSLGIKSYSESIIDILRENTFKGTYITYPSGKKRSIESAIRTNILTSVQQMCGHLQELRADEMNCDLMELTAHADSRPEHAEWQGKIVSRSGKQGYLSLEDIGYGKVDGFKGANCRHDWMPYFEGEPRTYTEKELKEMQEETVTYNNKEYTTYEASQIQRKIERNIRNNKKDITIAQTILKNSDDEELIKNATDLLEESKIKLKNNNRILNEFLEQTNRKKDNSRLKI